MDEEQIKSGNLLETTDCLEAIGVFKGWKNFLFAIVMLCLILLQLAFWLVDRGCVKVDRGGRDEAAVVTDDTKETSGVAEKPAGKTEDIKEAAEQVAAEANMPIETAPQPQPKIVLPVIQFRDLARFIHFFNFILIPAAVLYCLTILFCLKISLLGRLGGINHISRAFFLSLAMLVLLLPWQKFLGGIFLGAMYAPDELLSRCDALCASESGCKIFCTILYYLRFTGYWLLVTLLLIFAQYRSIRWANTILRRLAIM